MLTKDQILQDRYTLQQLLGNNASRQTWLANDRQTGAIVVVKLLAFSPQMQWDDLRLFEREATILQQLNHPQIPRYLNSFSIDPKTGEGLCWFGLVQEYVPGVSLEERLRRGERFTLAQIRAIAEQVLAVLSYLHGLEPPVLHRDLKPSNLILNDQGQVSTVDFGAVQNQAALEGVTFTVVGTTGYTPLEQFWGKAVPASDLYALGATLIHLLTGVAPADLPQRNLRLQFSDRVSLDPTFLAWIEALTAPDLEQRYETAQQALADLQAGRSLPCTLRPIEPPIGQRIQLCQSPEQLQVEIKGWQQLLFLPLDLAVVTAKSTLAVGSLISLLFTIVSLFGFLIFGGLSILASAFWVGALMLIWLLLGIGFAFLGYYCMKALKQELASVHKDLQRSSSPFLALGQHRLEMDRDCFTLTQTLWGFPIRRLKGRTTSIRAIKNDHNTIVIETLATDYNFSYRLSTIESRWLINEIATWLNQ